MLNDKRALCVLDLVHCDLWGPTPVVSRDGFRYYALFVDDYSHFSWLYPLHTKSEFFEVLKRFTNLVCNQFNTSIKVFQSDGGTEFTNSNIRNFFAERGVLHRFSCPYTPQQNGRAERKHRHITETGLSMLFHAHAPVSYWIDVFTTDVYTIKRLPSPLLDNKSPFELLFVCVPSYANFKVFGCRVYPYLRDYSPNKLAPRS